jgi:hypothetical protein
LPVSKLDGSLPGLSSAPLVLLALLLALLPALLALLPTLLPTLLALLLAFLPAFFPTVLAAFLAILPAPVMVPVAAPGTAAFAMTVAVTPSPFPALTVFAPVSSAHSPSFSSVRSTHDGVSCTRSRTGVTPTVLSLSTNARFLDYRRGVGR